MTHWIHHLLTLLLLPEHEHQDFLRRVSAEVAAAIAQENELEDEAVLELVAEAVWSYLEG